MTTATRHDQNKYMSNKFWKSLTEEISHVFIERIETETKTIDQYLFIQACKEENIEMMDICLANGADPSFDNNNAICTASMNGCISVVIRLLQDDIKDRVNPACTFNFAIRHASFHGHVAIVDRLLQDSRVDPKADIFSSIRDAAMNGHVDVVDLLLQDGRFDLNCVKENVFYWAKHHGHTAVVERLCRHNWDFSAF